MSKSIFVLSGELRHDEVGSYRLNVFPSREQASDNVLVESDRVVELSHVETWALVTELPDDAAPLLDVVLHENSDADRQHIITLCVFVDGYFWSLDGSCHETEDVLCWRPARPIGELPKPMEPR